MLNYHFVYVFILCHLQKDDHKIDEKDSSPTREGQKIQIKEGY